MKFVQFHRFSTLIDSASKSPNSFTVTSGKRLPIPLPHRTLPEPRGQDLDYVNVAHSHLLHSDWTKLYGLLPKFNPSRVNHILLKLQDDYALSLKFFKWVESHNPNLLTLETSSLILHILTKNRKFVSAESILKKIIGCRGMDFHPKLFDAILHSYRMCNSSPRVFDSLFKTYAHMKQFRNATDTFSRMKEYGFLPNVESCNLYMSSLLSLNRGDIVLAFYREMQRSRILVNVYTLNMVIKAFLQLGKLEKAVEVFAQMESMGFRPSVSSYNTLVAGYAHHGLLSSGMKLKDVMEKNGVRPDAITYNTLIHGFCKDGKLQEAYRLFSEMKRIGVDPNTVTYNTLISGYCEAGQTDKGSQVFEEMLRDGIEADILTYNALLLGVCKQGKTKKAAYLVKELDKKKLVPNASTFAALITGQCSRNPERAFQLYKSMIKSGCRPNENTLKMLILSFLGNDDYDGTVEVLKEMFEKSVVPVSAILNEVCEELSQIKKDRLIVKLSKEVEDGHFAHKHYEKVMKIISQSSADDKEIKKL